jgi:hypothetical protein
MILIYFSAALKWSSLQKAGKLIFKLTLRTASRIVKLGEKICGVGSSCQMKEKVYIYFYISLNIS